VYLLYLSSGKFRVLLMIMAQGILDTTTNCINYMRSWDIVKVVKAGRLKWLGHLFTSEDMNPCRKLTFTKPENTRRGRPPHKVAG
jgi:hypothetical protein